MDPALVPLPKLPPPTLEFCRIAAVPVVTARPWPLPKDTSSKPVFGSMEPLNELVEPESTARVLLLLTATLKTSGSDKAPPEITSDPADRMTAGWPRGGLVHPEPITMPALVKLPGFNQHRVPEGP